MKLKLPIGIQDFRDLRTSGNVYVDKTEHMFKMGNEARYYFLSRPRRFGKSLLISTLAELFSGSKELFEGLWIYDKWDWSQRHPVIHISFNTVRYQHFGLEKALGLALEDVGKEHGIQFETTEIGHRFQELIRKLASEGNPPVILIDVYDKPIIDFMDDIPQADANRKIMKSFYSILKDEGKNIRLLLITGVSKFSQVSIFSDLNHLRDITIDPKFSTICGLTQPELERNFKEWIDELAQEKQFGNREKLLKAIKKWYNGYSWDGVNLVYNPFGVLNFFGSGAFQNHWFRTGTPTFLVTLLTQNLTYDLDDLDVSETFLESYDLQNLEIKALLFQTGYLTVKKKITAGFRLGYPNKEVRDALQQFLLSGYSHVQTADGLPRIGQMYEALRKNDPEKMVSLLNSLFKNIPNHIFLAHSEAYFHSIVHLTFSLMGIYCDSEVNSSDGRMDAVVKTSKFIYLLEFKVDKSPEEAFAQIVEKDYAAKFRHGKRPVFGIGIALSSEKKAISGWKSGQL